MDSSALTILCLLACFWKSGFAIYFAQTGGSLSLSLGVWPENTTIQVLRAILEPDDSGHILYTISSRSQDLNCPDLFIHPELGSLSILPSKGNNDNEGPYEGVECNYKAVAELKGKPGLRNKGRAELRLKLNMSSPLTNSVVEGCPQFSVETLCFGGSEALNISVMENSESFAIAFLGQLNHLCGNFYLNYNITSEDRLDVLSINEIVEVGPSPYIVWSKPFLDRETRASYNFSLTCYLTSTETSDSYDSATLPLTLTVLDQDDNPIESQDGSQHVTVFISFSQQGNRFEAGARLSPIDHDDLLAKDNDTPEANSFTMKSLNDTKGLLVFDMSMHKNPFTKVDSSAVLSKIKLSDKAKSTSPWDGFYCVAVDVKDVNLVIQHPPMRYTICLHWGQYNPTSTAPKISLEELKSRLKRRRNVGTLSRSANTHSVVMYPFPDLVTDFSQLVPGLQFQLNAVHPFENENKTLVLAKIYKGRSSKTTQDFPFAVTDKSGIIYLLDPNAIKDGEIKGFHLRLSYNSTLQEHLEVNVTVYLEETLDNSSATCQGEYCAEFSDSKTCKSACGFGAIGNCSWRDYNQKNSTRGGEEHGKSLSYILYPTCSSNLGTCPDGKCDELESKFPQMCPQDCATEINGFGRLRKHVDGEKHGVEHCSGVCTCHGPYSCSCAHLPMPLMPGKDQRGGRGGGHNNNVTFSTSGRSDQPNLHPSVSYKTFDHTLGVFETAEPPCGRSCITVYASASVAVTIFIGSIVLFAWKRRSKKKRKSTQSLAVDPTDLELSTGYGDHGGNRILSDAEYVGPGRVHGTNLGGIISPNGHFNPDHVFQVESKWEIPREDLLTEQVLGEGEFGRVLKGVLRSVTGSKFEFVLNTRRLSNPPHTKDYVTLGTVHVAVKMLKVDHIEGNKSLRQEFMAEFSLLKQLDHPNVIKLLGACTKSGGPPYLVMEYAEFGSLRSFLRKCRRVEKITHNFSSEWCSPERRGNKRSSADVQDFEYIVTPQEVLGFSWQIAKGMAYLSDMKMVHRDLAARNILLTKTKVCKISDFGLTRDIYVDDTYRKKSKDRVPVKWLAPECLTDELYTSKSDVWAFGILLWELTTLGASPYPGIQTELLYSLLDSGHRMQQPVNCSNKVYAIMRKCWGKSPIDRPSFHELVYELSRLLEDGIEYLKLDIPSVSNPGYDIFMQEQAAEASTSPATAVISERPQGVRRNSSMENLRLIDYEIPTTDEFIVSQLISDLRRKHTYINNPSPKQSRYCEKNDNANSSGYESPITLSTE